MARMRWDKVKRQDRLRRHDDGRRKLKAKYASECASCGRPVEVGQWIAWTPGVKAVSHWRCVA